MKFQLEVSRVGIGGFENDQHHDFIANKWQPTMKIKYELKRREDESCN